jgi:hypothetical protein
MNDPKKPFIVGNWDDLFLANKIRALERKKKLNLYLATVGCMAFGLFGAVLTKGAPADSALALLQAQRALALTAGFAIVLLVSSLFAIFISRTPERVAMLESALMKGFGTALDASELNPNKKDNKKGEVRT